MNFARTNDPKRSQLAFLVWLIVALALGPWTLAEETPSLTLVEGIESHAGMDRIYKSLSDAYRSQDASKIARLYSAKKAFHLIAGQDVIQGRSAIESTFADFFTGLEKRQQDVEISFEILNRTVSGTHAYDVGVYTMRFKSPTRQATNRGKFLLISACEEGQCRIEANSLSGLPPRAETNIQLPES